MKKISVLFIILLIYGITVFAGTTGTTTYSGKVVIKTMAYGDNSNQEGQDWIRIVDAFEAENPNIDIDYEILYDEAYHQKVTARLASGDIPHLAYMGAGPRWGAPWKEAGQQFDHRPFIDPDYYDLDLIPAMGPDGEIYEIPIGTSNITTVLYMNEELVRYLGFSTPETYEDIVAMVPAARAAGIDVITIDGADGWAWGSCLLSIIIARLSGDPHWVSKAVEGTYRFTDQVFVDSLSMLARMVGDRVITDKSIFVDYGANISIFSNEEALFMIQGQWAAGGIDRRVADKTVMLSWPKWPGEKSNVAGSVAAAIQVGYGITKAGAADRDVRDAALKFIKYYNSEPEVTRRLRNGSIVAPILKNYKVPDDLPSIIKSKVALAQGTRVITNIIDEFLSGKPNDALNVGMQKIVSGAATPEEVAMKVEELLRW